MNWLYLYLIGCPFTMAAVALFAFERRKAHDMRPIAVVRLTFLAGLLWPLLAVAAAQVLGLVVLAMAFGSARRFGSRALDLAEHPEPTIIGPAKAA